MSSNNFLYICFFILSSFVGVFIDFCAGTVNDLISFCFLCLFSFLGKEVCFSWGALFFKIVETGVADRLLIETTTGNVGIGTASPNQKLQVVGNVNISGDLWVQGQNTTVPDYVFEEGYNLMDLVELGNYIEENNELPDSEIQGSFGDAPLNTKQLFLLEKVEEQTLYILDLKKENEILLEKSEQMAEDLCSLGIVRWC